jgi:hypothetical protein
MAAHVALRPDVRTGVQLAMLALFLATFVVACVIITLRAERVALLAAPVAAGGSIVIAELACMALHTTLMPGLYQVDYDPRLFWIEQSTMALYMGLWAALLALVIAAVTLALRGLIHRLRGRTANGALA